MAETVRTGALRRLLPTLRWIAAPFLAILCCASGDWPQWRGPAGLGVANEADLPVVLDGGSPDLLWKVELKGEGISSPIVSRGRVFVTTAYPGVEYSRWQSLKVFGLPFLALAVLAFAALGLRRGAPAAAAQPVPFLFRLDALATWTATLAFLPVALLAAFRPRLFPAWAEGVLGWGWFWTGGIGLVGLVAALGWLGTRSLGRLVGAALLLASAYYLHRNIGLNSFGQSFKTRERWIMIAPALVGAAWHTTVFLRARALPVQGRGPRSALASAALAFMATILFSTVNLLQPRAGLVRAMLCHDLATGARLWDAPLFVAPKEQKYDINSFATPTPCTDGEYVFAYYGSGWACVDFDGKIVWQGRDDQYAPNTRYGCGASPVLFEEAFIVLQEREYVRPSYIVAFDKATGREHWRVNPKYASDSYCTPILVPRQGTTELITASGERAVAHDPRSGDQLWQVPLRIRQMVPSPVWFEDLLLVSGGTHTKTSSSAVRLSGVGKETQTEVLWQTIKGTPSVSSPVLVDGCYFVTEDNGILSCFDPRSGELHWKERLASGTYWASLVGGDGKVYAVSEEGVVSVVAARPTFELLGRGELGEGGVYSTPAIADGCVLVRAEKHLFCFGKPGI